MDAVEPADEAAGDEFLVLPAEEIDTTEGQIIGLFLSQTIEPWQSPGETIDQIHEQGGLALAPHPFDAVREGLKTIADHVNELDAIETLNSRCFREKYNYRAQDFAEEHGITAAGGSDAHFAREVGTAYTHIEVDNQTLAGVKDAIRDGTDRTAWQHWNTRCPRRDEEREAL